MKHLQLIVLLGLASTPLAAQQASVAMTPFEFEGSVGMAADEYDALSRAVGVLLTSELAARRDGKVTTIAGVGGGRTGRLDVALARTRATSTGASLLVIGSLLDQYGDVHLEARVVDAASGATVGVVRGDPRLATREQLGEGVADLAQRLASEAAVGGASEARWRRTLSEKALVSFGKGLRFEEGGDRVQAAAAFRAALAAAPSLTEAKSALSRVGG